MVCMRTNPAFCEALNNYWVFSFVWEYTEHLLDITAVSVMFELTFVLCVLCEVWVKWAV